MNSGNGKCFTCPADRRVFKTKAALAQHRRASHGGAAAPAQRSAGPRPGTSKRGRNNAGPGRMAAPVRSANSQMRVVIGSDIVGVYEISNKAAAGQVLAEIPITPATFAGSRLHQESTLWARWRPQQLNLTITSSAGFMVTGSYMVGWTADSGEVYSNGLHTIARVGALVPSMTAFIGQQSMLSLPCDTTQKWLYVDSREQDDSEHGKIVIVLNAAVGTLASGNVTLTATLRWKVAFEGPRLQSEESSEVIYADSGYAGYHTTSTADWAGGAKLSLKAHAGGGLVPFPKANPQTVYSLDSQAKLQYYDTDGTTLKDVKYGVLIPNFSVKAFAVFADKAKALKFAQTGDSTHCLDYKAAGTTVDPDNPAWTAMVSAKAVRSMSEQDQRLAELEEEVKLLRLQLAMTEEPSGFS